MILAFIVIQEAGLPGDDIIVIMTTTVGLSVYLHGLSAVPGANWYANWANKQETASATDADPPAS